MAADLLEFVPIQTQLLFEDAVVRPLEPCTFIVTCSYPPLVLPLKC